MDRARTAVVVLAAAVASLSGASAATAAPIVHKPQVSDVSARDYWTPERMREARGLRVRRVALGSAPAPALAPPAAADLGPAVIDPATSRPPRPPVASGRIRVPPFKSGQVPPAEMTGYPYSANGRLYGKFRVGGPFSCSATVVNSPSRSVVLTAGHCVHDHNAGWARHLVFVPAYLRGERPFGTWKATRVASTRGWVRSENFHGDYSAIKLSSPSGPVGEVVGEEGLVWNQPRDQQFQAIGYPFNRGRTELMWNCTSASIGADPFDRSRGKPDTGIGCDMGGGASGGGWTIRDGNGDPYVNGVTSFGYNRVKNILFSPYLTGKVAGVVNQANGG